MILFRLVTIMFTALSMAMAFSHLLQLPPRMEFAGSVWLTTQRVFPLYGSIGAFIEVGAIILAGVLAFAVRHRRSTFGLTAAGAGCLAAALVVWFVFVAPANVQITQWAANSMPADWTQWRTQWEYAHAARALLLIVGLGLLIQSVLIETKQTKAHRSQA